MLYDAATSEWHLKAIFPQSLATASGPLPLPLSGPLGLGPGVGGLSQNQPDMKS